MAIAMFERIYPWKFRGGTEWQICLAKNQLEREMKRTAENRKISTNTLKQNRKYTRKAKVLLGRACKICGKNSYPNYFYCPTCHHMISKRSDSYDLYEQEQN